MFGLPLDASSLTGLWLVIARVGAMWMTMPVFGDQEIPMQIKAVGVFAVSIALWSLVPAGAVPVFDTLPAFAAALAGEILIGVLVGTMVRLIHGAVQFSGHFIGFQMGLGIVTVVDPTTGGRMSQVGKFQGVFALVIFLAMDMHHFMLRGLAWSLTETPSLSLMHGGGSCRSLIDAGAGMFVLAVQVGAPVMVALFLTNVALGIVARTVPQMNIFIVGFPLTIGIGLIIMGVAFPAFVNIVQEGYRTAGANALALLGSP